MKILPTGLQEHLDSGSTSMVFCWRITRLDGVVMGFAEHDENLIFDGTEFKAATGFSATNIQKSLGLSVDNLDVQGALSSNAITEKDIAAGRYDDATVELIWVNFNDVSQRLLLNKGFIGQLTRTQYSFNAELRSLASKLQQPTGRLYQRTCDANLGDSRCKLNLEPFATTGTITGFVDERFVFATLAVTNPTGYFAFGYMEMLSGNGVGLKYEIHGHTVNPDGSIGFELWESPVITPEVGDTLKVYPGCDKSRATCKDKFNNIINYQGFSFIPGADFITRYASRDSTQTGESIFGFENIDD